MFSTQMKISEVRTIVDKYPADKLKLIVSELYKAIPKAVRADRDIDGFLRDPDSQAQSRSRNRHKETPDIELLKDELESFVDDAYNQYYLAPNRFVPKRERPKWRFIVKRLYKDLLAAASDESNVPEAARLLEKLYQMLCYSCGYVLFTAYDPFQSVGIEQMEFFRRVLALKCQCEDKHTFIKNALLSMVNNSLSRYTLHEDLMEVILEFTRTPDLKEMAIALCSELTEAIKRESPPKKERRSSFSGHQSECEKEGKLNSLTIMAFLACARLYEYPRAISYYKANCCHSNKEISLYVLLDLLFRLGQKDYFLQEYEKAVESGVTPRDVLRKVYHFTKEKGELPATFR